MYKKVLIFIAFLIVNVTAMAEDSNHSDDYSIPYIKSKYIVDSLPGNLPKQTLLQANGSKVSISEEITNLKPQNIQEIANIGEKFCKKLSGSDVKIWFKLGANGNIGIAELSAESGVEVTFHCKK